MKSDLVLSSLGHTWLFDIDGTIVKHNGYKIDGYDTLLPGVKEFWGQIPSGDTIILLSSREERYREMTESFLREHGLRFDLSLFDLPRGERILFNDDKPSGLCMSWAVQVKRDAGIEEQLSIDTAL